ncbi:MAG: hypothetical protein MI976_25345 [Pseudomonadales bacterium]|nr:hypothetical protein [Pseudomonadales bacterium]
MKKLIVVLLAMIAFGGIIAATDEIGSAKALVTDNVMFVPVEYRDGVWYQAEQITYAPCEPPSKPSLATDADPIIRAYTVEGEVAYEQGMRNPRLILIEDPKQPVGLLREISFELRLPYLRGLSRVEFWESPREQQEPSLVFEVDEAADIPEKADCQVPEFVPDALRNQ